MRREGDGLPVVVSAHVRNGYTIIAVLKLTVGAMLLPRRVFFGEFPVVLRWCQTGKWASSIDGSVHAPHHTPSSTRLKLPLDPIKYTWRRRVQDVPILEDAVYIHLTTIKGAV